MAEKSINKWQKVNFDSFFDVLPSKKYQVQRQDYLSNGDIPVVDQGQSLIAGYTNDKSKIFNHDKVIIFGDHTRIVKYIDFEFAVGADGTQILGVKQNINLKFAYYQLLNKKIPDTGYNRHFKYVKAEDYYIPPTLEEQQEIVDVLDAADRIISLRTACIESAQSIIPALFQEMFSQYANSQNRTKLNYLFEFKSGGTPSKQVKEFFTGKIPWVTTIALNKLFIDQNDANELITEDAIKKSSTKLIPANSLLFGTRVGIGKLAINKVPMCTNQDIAALIPLKNNNLNLIYTYWYLKQINKFFVANGRGATIKGITTNLVKNTEIILPPMEQQELFAEKVQEIEAYIKTQQVELENAKTMFKSLLHHSFTGELTRRAYGE